MRSVILCFLLLSGTVHAQIQKTATAAKSNFDAPKEGDVGKAIWLNFEGALGADPQFVCAPANEDWKALKTFEDKVVIVFTPQTAGTYTFIVASNSNNKTSVVTHTIVIGGSPDIVPDDTKKVGKYDQRLTAVYMVNPDNAQLLKLIAALKKHKSGKYTTLADAAADLKTEASAAGLGDPTSPILRSVRDEIKAIIVEENGSDGSKPFDEAKYKAVITEIVSSLNKLSK